MNNIAVKNNNTMTSTQLSELLNFPKKEINRKIKLMFSHKIDGGIITPSYDTREYVIDYNLPELESKMFVAKHDIQYLEMITQYWIDKSKPVHQIPQTYAEALQLAADQTKLLEIAAPKAEYFDKVLSTTNGFTTTEIASELSMSAIKLNRQLKTMNVQRKIGNRWVLTVGNLNKGYATERTYIDDNDVSRHSMLWTEKGRNFIHELMEVK